MTLKKDILTSIIAVAVLTVVLGFAYPLLITGVSQVAFPGNANGQQVHAGGKLVASKIIGQQFADPVLNPATGKPKLDSGGGVEVSPDPRYFQTRPSGTVPADNAAATTFANLGPNDKATEQAIAANIKAYLALEKPYDHGLTTATIPVDAVDTSASGIDPDISVANADIQAHRVAAVRHLSAAAVDRLVSTYTAGRGLGFSGEPAVNVVELNLALDHVGGF
jgi:K+-transporting ATPase ATPase C chain